MGARAFQCYGHTMTRFRPLFLVITLVACGSQAQRSSAEAGVYAPDALRPRDAESPRDAASPDAASAMLLTGALPNCSYPAPALEPSAVPDGSVAGWKVYRTFLVCGACVETPGDECCYGGGDYGDTCKSPPCALGCAPGQYAVVTFQDSFIDADVSPSFPVDCTGTTRLVSKLLMSFDEAPQVGCCPCL